MSKYNTSQFRPPEEKIQNKIHPIWRGVGFAFLVLIPLISYAATEVLVQQNQKLGFFPWPYDIVAKPGDLIYNGDPLLYFKILITIAFMLVLFAIFSLITFMVNSAFGAPRYGPLDVPPINARVRKKAR